MATRVQIGIRLTEEAIAILDETAERLGGLSRATVIELLARAYATKLTPETKLPIDAIAIPGARAGRTRKPVGKATRKPNSK